jgi:glutathione S-transferase
MSTPQIRLFTFSPLWGLPTAGPFGLKLEACLRMLDIPYERVYEDDNRKGPKRKSPWIEDGSVRMGDTELILKYVEERYGRALDRSLTPAQRAESHLIRRAIEEHYHQVFEYELFVRDEGFAVLRKVMAKSIPRLLLPLVSHLVRSAFRKHLFERGIARHAPADVEAMGRADIDALAVLLDRREWLVGDEPCKADASAFGHLAISILSDLPTPVCRYARTLPPLVRYVERARDRFFPELSAARPLGEAARA